MRGKGGPFFKEAARSLKRESLAGKADFGQERGKMHSDKKSQTKKSLWNNLLNYRKQKGKR